MPLVQAVEETSAYSQLESRALFHPQIHPTSWVAAVEAAKAKSTANHGPTLIDWRHMKLVDLALSKEGGVANWSTWALDGGFVALPTHPSWLETNGNVVVRYGGDGRLMWAVRVAMPSAALASRRCRKFWPQAVYTDHEFLVLADVCETLRYEEAVALGKDEIGMNLKIPLRRLPGGGLGLMLHWEPGVSSMRN